MKIRMYQYSELDNELTACNRCDEKIQDQVLGWVMVWVKEHLKAAILEDKNFDIIIK